MDLGLTGRACIVTGASGGIGAATARELCAEGADVLLVARRTDALEAAADAARAAGGRAETLTADVTDPKVAEQVVRACTERFDEPYALVNGAGTSAVRSLDELTDVDWQRQWDLHVMGPMRLMRVAAPRMAARGEGRIVNVASSAGKRPSPRLDPAYSVTKAAELSLSRTFADLYARDGVLVNAVAPGMVETGLWTAPGGMADQVAERQGIDREQALADARERIPLGRMGRPDEIAAVIVFLCSARASDVAGAAWSVDGGTFQAII
ncbi:MAG TPA: SDR family oxidoreductase [Solirubrobacteraceae bacterium]|jgi:3-oxoacyl-[acyl-carrier protein] reductase|nr:SDR family oxidoreductase [Solirubrobacteraceae bacterium]